jgi:peptidoglycan/LPS O-acetylase OafA/YrhL
MSILGFAMHHLNRRNRFLPKANEMVYPFYILHQKVVVAIAYILMDVSWSVVLKLEFIAAATFIICFLLIRYIIMPLRILRILFGLKPKAKPTEVKQAQPAIATILKIKHCNIS